MSDTPRTNKEQFFPHDSKYQVCDADFCRQLERELNAANQIAKNYEDRYFAALDRIKRLEEMYEGVIGEQPELLGSNVMGLLKRELNAAQRRIKRLEEFVEQLTNPKFTRDDLPKEALLQRIKRLEEAGDKIVESGWSVQDWSGMCVVWAKAKEAKP